MNVIELISRMVLYLIFIVGIFLLFLPIIQPYIEKKYLIKKIKKINYRSRKFNYSFMENIKLYINTVYKGNYKFEKFIMLEILLFFMTALLAYSIKNNILISIISGFLSMILPIILVSIRFKIIQVENSYDGEKLIIELLSNYKIYNCNIIEALYKTYTDIDYNSYLKKILHKLCYRINEYKSDSELSDALKEFTMSIGTKWGVLLANSIHTALIYQDDITSSLNNILEDIKQIRTVIEKNNQYNNESFVIIKFIIPISYILSLVCAIKYMNFSFNKFLAYQFHTSLGLRVFIMLITMFAINYIVYCIIKKPKFDL